MQTDWSTQMFFYTDEENSWLKGSEIVGYVDQMKKKVDHDYALVLANIPDFETEYSELEFFENFKTIQTRMFGLKDTDGDEISALVPIGDFFNHRNRYVVEWTYGEIQNGEGGPSKSGLIYTAVTDIMAGEQVTASYGAKSNFRLLSQYGFIDPFNKITQ